MICILLICYFVYFCFNTYSLFYKFDVFITAPFKCILFIFRLRFFPNFAAPKEADVMFDILFHELPWRQRSDVKNGEKYLQPRLTAWYGDFPYSYSGVTHEAHTDVSTC